MESRPESVMTGIEGYARYAIFWAPPAGSGLARFGARWLGWDAGSGHEVAQPSLALPRPLDQITRTPRRYGFHATLKPPFRLADSTTAAALDRALAALVARTPPATAPGLAPSARLGFLALMPTGPAPVLDALAAACTRGLDRFRAPPDAAELAPYRARSLTSRQEHNLTRWGYPYVLGDFRFHLTLSDRLRPGEVAALTEAVTALAAPHLAPLLHLDDICLYGDPGSGSGFRLLRRYPLTG
jgi:putative phosphonate metabolism protein